MTPTDMNTDIAQKSVAGDQGSAPVTKYLSRDEYLDLLLEVEKLETKVEKLETEVSVTKDFSDDLVSASSNVLSVATIWIPVLLTLLSIAAVGLTVWIQKQFSKSAERHLEEAKESYREALLNDEQARKDFVDALANHPNVRTTINSTLNKMRVELADRDKRDRDKQLKDFIGVLQNSLNGDSPQGDGSGSNGNHN